MQMSDRQDALLRVQHVRRLHRVWQKKHGIPSLQDAVDPRSPTIGIRRTPMKPTASTPVSRVALIAAMQLADPRSPNIHRTPLAQVLGLADSGDQQPEVVAFSLEKTEEDEQPVAQKDGENHDEDPSETLTEPASPRASPVEFSAMSTPKTPATPEPAVSEPMTPSSTFASDRIRRQFTSSVLAEMSPMQLSPSKLRKLQSKDGKRVGSVYSISSVASMKSQRSFHEDKENDATASPVQQRRVFGSVIATS